MIKNKKGFTLIELMAVIIILAVIGLIVFPSAIESVNNSKEKLYREQVDRILDATDSYSASHDSELSETSNTVITVEDLQKAGLLKNEKLKNPLNSKIEMVQNIVIYFDSEYNQYVAVYCDTEYGNYYYTEEEDFNNMKTVCSANVNSSTE